MGMTIDNSCETKPMSKEEIVDTLKTMVFGVQAFERFNAKERETLDRAWNIIDQYENRLKADMVAMLEKLKSEIENKSYVNINFEGRTVELSDIQRIIINKIYELRGETGCQRL